MKHKEGRGCGCVGVCGWVNLVVDVCMFVFWCVCVTGWNNLPENLAYQKHYYFLHVSFNNN